MINRQKRKKEEKKRRDEKGDYWKQGSEMKRGDRRKGKREITRTEGRGRREKRK